MPKKKKVHPDSFQQRGKRLQLVEELKAKGILDNRVLDSISLVPRHLFMDSGLVDFAYSDSAYPISAGQTISQPYTVARQTELLKVDEGMKILEIGTGSGYQAAVLAGMGARVYSIERQRELYERSLELLTNLGYTIQLFFGDGFKGLPTYGPFHRILITAAAPVIPPALVEQLVPGGLMVLPLGEGKTQTMVRVTRKPNQDYSTESFGQYAFVPMLPGTQR